MFDYALGEAGTGDHTVPVLGELSLMGNKSPPVGQYIVGTATVIQETSRGEGRGNPVLKGGFPRGLACERGPREGNRFT